MLRNWTLAAVTGLALLTPLAAAPAAQAAGPEAPREADHDRDHDRDRDRDHDRQRGHRDFDVMHRPCGDAPWRFYGRYDDRWDAERTEHCLRGQGH